MYMLCAKFGSEWSEDCPAQTSDPSFARTIRRLAIYLPTHYFLCGTCMLIEPWCIVAVEQWTKISFLSTMKDGSKLLTRESVCIKSMYRKTLFTDCVCLLSAIFDRVSQHLSYMYAQKRSIIDNVMCKAWICTKHVFAQSMDCAVRKAQSSDLRKTWISIN